VVIEDAAAGIEAAIKGGFRTVGLGPRERVGKAQAVFPSLAGVRLEDLWTALGVKLSWSNNANER
jgi:beta-phosphoglucomutase-like phosphatase (HAD superfamily)